MKTFFARQGEVGFFLASGPVPEWPKLEMERGQTILGHSETGHHHVLERPEAATVLVVDPNPPEGLRILRMIIAEPTRCVHLREYDTHEAVELPPGDYEVRTPVEFDHYAEMARAVAD